MHGIAIASRSFSCCRRSLDERRVDMRRRGMRRDLRRVYRGLRVRLSRLEASILGHFVRFAPPPVSQGVVRVRNKYFDPDDLATYAPFIRDMQRFDHDLRVKTLDRYTRRQRAWEYATFLSWFKSLRGVRMLDIGPGASAFSLFLQGMWARVTTFDLPAPFQDRRAILQRYGPAGVAHCAGTMMELPFADEAFDVVVSVSAIEHLQQYPSDPSRARPYDLFVEDTRRALREM